MASSKRGLAILLDEHDKEEMVMNVALRRVRKSCLSRDKLRNMYDPSQVVIMSPGRCERTYRDYLVDALAVSEVALVAFLVYYGRSSFPEEPTAGEWCTTPLISLMDLLQPVVESLITSAFDMVKSLITALFDMFSNWLPTCSKNDT